MKFLAAFLTLTCAVSALPARAGMGFTDEEIKESTKISKGRYIGGGITGTIAGLGIGHAVIGHGFYAKRGWIFTVSESIGYGVMIGGLVSCGTSAFYGSYRTNWSDACTTRQKTAILSGYLLALGFHIWEIVDVWTTPLDYNDRHDALTGGRDRNNTSYYLMPLPNFDSGNVVWTAGLSQRF